MGIEKDKKTQNESHPDEKEFIAKMAINLQKYLEGEVEGFTTEDWMTVCKFFEDALVKSKTDAYLKSKPNITFYG